MDDRRAHARFPAESPVHVKVPSRTAFAREYLLNIGRGGCFIVSDAPVESGQDVSVRFDIAGRVSVVLDGEVTHASPGPPRGFGVRFKDVGLDRLAHLDDFIAGTVGEVGTRGTREDTRELPLKLVQDLVRESTASGEESGQPSAAAAPARVRSDQTPVVLLAKKDPTPIGYREVTPMEIDVDLLADAVEEPSGDWLAPESGGPMPAAARSALPDLAASLPRGGPAPAPASSIPRDLPPPPPEGADPLPWVTSLVEHFIGRLGGENVYVVLAASANESTKAILSRGRVELERLAKARAMLAADDDGLADQLEALHDTIQGALDEVASPTQRATLDLQLGHYTPAGRTPQEQLALAAAAETLRAPYLRDHPVLAHRASVFGKAAEREAAAGDVDRALESARRAVGLDPHNLELRELLATVEGMAHSRGA